MNKAKQVVTGLLRKLGLHRPRFLLRRDADKSRQKAAEEAAAVRTTAVLNAIASTNGTARILRRELEALRCEVQAQADIIRDLTARLDAKESTDATGDGESSDRTTT